MLEKKDLVYPDLSYQIIGCAYDVFNSLGGGHKESIYQKAMALTLKEKKLAYTEQQYYPIKYKDVVVGRNFFDFYVEQKIVVELKASVRFTKQDFEQVLNYLRVSDVKLALLISFGEDGVRCKRVVNFQTLSN